VEQARQGQGLGGYPSLGGLWLIKTDRLHTLERLQRRFETHHLMTGLTLLLLEPLPHLASVLQGLSCMTKLCLNLLHTLFGDVEAMLAGIEILCREGQVIGHRRGILRRTELALLEAFF